MINKEECGKGYMQKKKKKRNEWTMKSEKVRIRRKTTRNNR